MRNGDEPYAVHILPSDGTAPTDPPLPPADTPRRWFVPLLAVAGVLGAFVLATRPLDSNAAGAATTQPPPLAAVAAELIDLTTQPVASNTSGEWFEAAFKSTGTINDVLRAGSSFIAVGSTAAGGQVWLSNTGASWSEVVFLEMPETARTSLDHAVLWHDDVVVLGSVDDGVCLWTAGTLASWVYQGQIESMASNRISGLAAGPELLAISAPEGRVQGWMSGDGIEWRSLGHLGDLDGAYIHTITANEDWYFAAGQTDCDQNLCNPVIYRSADGIDWESTDGETPGLLSTDGGMVVDLAVVADGIVAVGWTGEFPKTSVAIWRSDDGSNWGRVAADNPLLQPAVTTIEVLGTRLGANAGATIEVNSVRCELAAGSEVMTDAGRFVISEITSSDIQIAVDGRKLRIASGETERLFNSAHPRQIAAEGPRIVVVGYLEGEHTRSPAIWSSTDGGSTWERTTSPDAEGPLTGTVMYGQNIVAIGAEPDSGDPVIWRTSWDTETAEATAVDVLQTYLKALDTHDPHTLVKLLPQARDGSAAPRFEIPSLGNISHDWWDSDTGALDIDRVAATVEYLELTGTSIEINGCTPTVSWGAVDRVNVSCGFEVSSTLLSTLGYHNGFGRIQAAISGGSLDDVALSVSPTVQMWSDLRAAISGASEADRATVLAYDEAGQPTFAPTFDGATATIHIRLAEKFIEGLLRPGDTRIVETALGTMEWRWIDPLRLPVNSFDWVTWSEFGFLATAPGRPGQRFPNLSVWASPDGLDWSEFPAPEGIESMWYLQPFLDGVAGQGSGPDSESVVYFDGDEWFDIPLPSAENRLQDSTYMAVGADLILVISGLRGEENELTINKAWMIGSDLVPKQVDLPTPDGWTDMNLGLVGTDDGFFVGLSDSNNSPKISIWHTTDGTDWRLIADSAGIDDASYVWNLQGHRSHYFVVGDAMELRCSTTVDGEVCEAFGLWSSPDGVAWDRVLTKNGKPLAAYEIGSGDLGLIAIEGSSQSLSAPRPVYLSPDGKTWEQAGSLSLLCPDVTWWSLSQPAVGPDTIIVTGNSLNEGIGDDFDVPFLIVGRVIDE